MADATPPAAPPLELAVPAQCKGEDGPAGDAKPGPPPPTVPPPPEGAALAHTPLPRPPQAAAAAAATP